MRPSHLVSSAEAARLVGVGPSSIKRWADQGVLPCVKTAGGHRRFERDAIARFLRERATVAHAVAPEISAWVERLVAGRRHDTESALFAARARLGAWHLVADDLGPVLVEIGRRWQRGEIAIADEHVASDCLARSLARVGDALPAPSRGARCLLACAEGDDHTLGLALAEICLREAGWLPVWLGRTTPRTEIARVVGEGGADLVALSASESAADAAALAAMAMDVSAACRRRNVTVVLGGSGAWPEGLRGTERVRSFGAFHAILARRR